MDTQKKDLLSNINDKPIDESKNNIERVISTKPIAPLTFLKSNKKLIGLNQNQFKEWLKLQYIAFCGGGHFVPTNASKKKGFMISENEYSLKLKPISKNEEQLVDISISCVGKITKEGQEYILDLIESEEKNNNE